MFIFDLSKTQLSDLVTSLGEPAYRTEQLWQGLYRDLWDSPAQATTLSRKLREHLQEPGTFQSLTAAKEFTSSDRHTRKTLFQLADGKYIETVLMTYEQRRTLCISTQSGCAMGCVFCATGQMGFRRNLTSGEIIAQVLHFARLLKKDDEQVTNIVVMGMGEPFHNYDATLQAVHQLNDPTGFNLGARRFTISTVGIIPKIRQFAALKSQVNLAISLHAANDNLRSQLLPVNNKYPLKELIQACRDYVETTSRRITFEYALIQSVNDSVEHAQELVRLIKGLMCHVNVIPLNPTHKYTGAATTRQRAQAFAAVLEAAGIPCTIRLRRGIDIQASCGQLAIEEKEKIVSG
ncbi:MAG: 23S rRNA (adenine(2503)-C(2))-methyltransferase RlmN [Anaerolineaceae bacterium]